MCSILLSMKEHASHSCDASVALYVTRQILSGPVETETVLKHHQSMSALIQYLKCHNLLIGEPEPYRPVVSVEHADGSALLPEEVRRLETNGVDVAGYRKRIRIALERTPLPQEMDPDAGTKNAHGINNMIISLSRGNGAKHS